MDYETWQHKRRELQDKEEAERRTDLARARAHIQVAITEQAVRDLYDRTDALESRLLTLETKRGPGRPPKSEGE